MEVLKKEDNVSQINSFQQDAQQKHPHELKDKQLQKKNSKNQDDDSPLSNYYVIGPLGRGGGSFVYKVASIKTKEQFALKVIDKTQPKFQKQSQERLQNEIEIQSQLKHENIIQLKSHFQDSQNYYLLMELAEQGELHTYLKKKGKFDEQEIQKLTYELGKTIKYLHQNNIIHRDLKMGNILLQNNKIKLADFGLAVKLTDDRPERDTLCGTINYISPEIINRENYGKKIDCWSFGCIIYAMATGKPPFENQNAKDTLLRVQAGQLNLNKNMSQQLQDLLKKTINWNCDERLSIEQILEHPFYKEQQQQDLLHNNLIEGQNQSQNEQDNQDILNLKCQEKLQTNQDINCNILKEKNMDNIQNKQQNQLELKENVKQKSAIKPNMNKQNNIQFISDNKPNQKMKIRKESKENFEPLIYKQQYTERNFQNTFQHQKNSNKQNYHMYKHSHQQSLSDIFQQTQKYNIYNLGLQNQNNKIKQNTFQNQKLFNNNSQLSFYNQIQLQKEQNNMQSQQIHIQQIYQSENESENEQNEQNISPSFRCQDVEQENAQNINKKQQISQNNIINKSSNYNNNQKGTNFQQMLINYQQHQIKTESTKKLESQQQLIQQKYQQQNKNKKQARPNSFALVNNQDLIEAQNIVKKNNTQKKQSHTQQKSKIYNINNCQIEQEQLCRNLQENFSGESDLNPQNLNKNLNFSKREKYQNLNQNEQKKKIQQEEQILVTLGLQEDDDQDQIIFEQQNQYISTQESQQNQRLDNKFEAQFQSEQNSIQLQKKFNGRSQTSFIQSQIQKPLNQNISYKQKEDISSYKSSLQNSLRSTLSSNNNNNNLNHQQSQKQEQFQEIDNIFLLQKAQSLNQESPSFSSNQDIKRTFSQECSQQQNKQNIQVFETKGLKSTKLKTQNGSISISSKGQLELEVINKNLMFIVSPNGKQITISKKKVLKTYDLQQLPEKYVKLYEYARQVVSTLKKKTILVKLENKEGIFSLMIDKQHFEAILKNGLKFQYDIFSQNIIILSEKYYLNKLKIQQEQDPQKIKNVQKQITINVENETELQSLEHDFQTGIQIAMKYLNESLDKAENMQQ